MNLLMFSGLSFDQISYYFCYLLHWLGWHLN